MKLFTPLAIAIRVVIYSLMIYGAAEAVFYDAGHPYGNSYFSERTLTEVGQEVILFLLFIFYLIIGYKWKAILPVSNIVSLFFLLSFIREFNFLAIPWTIPAALVLVVIAWLVWRDFGKIKKAAVYFFSTPASSWFISGFLVTFIFSRLMGRSKFWRMLYDEENYRLAKAATEEGIELLGDSLMLISAVEFFLYYRFQIQIKEED